RRGDNLADPHQREMLVLAHQLNQALLAKLAKIILWLGHTVAVSQKNISCLELGRALVVRHVVEQTDNRAPRLQSPDPAIFTDDDRRQVPAVAVGNCARFTVIDAEE